VTSVIVATGVLAGLKQHHNSLSQDVIDLSSCGLETFLI